ncbi:MAG: hypothetical protein JWM96_597 [Alphaproteobacteria bacterium]|nr:hypothetical protein [Alphaproteobacteria bacterium]
MRILLSTLAILAVTFSLSACNTVDGAGEDMAAGGHAVSRTARDVQH